MSALMTLVQSAIKESSISQISQQLGQDEQATSNAIDTALPMLIGALGRSTKQDGGAGLNRALETRHDGSILDDVAGYVAKNDQADGDGILGHILGQNKGLAAQMLGSASGLETDKAQSLMATLAPVLLGALGKAKSRKDLSGGDLTHMLTGESESLQQRTPSMMNAVWGLLDADGDGDTDLMDIVKHGSKGLGRFLR